MADPVSDAISYVGSIIGFSAKTPIDLLLNIILPIPILTYAFGLLLETLGIFKGSGVRYIIGFVLAATLVFGVKIGALGLWLGIAGVFIFKMKDWPSRIIGFILFVVLITQIGFNLDPAILYNKAFIIGFVIVGLIILFTEMSPLKKIIVIGIVLIILFAVFSLISSYVPALKF
jgi:hypothetical protein